MTVRGALELGSGNTLKGTVPINSPIGWRELRSCSKYSYTAAKLGRISAAVLI